MEFEIKCVDLSKGELVTFHKTTFDREPEETEGQEQEVE
jgi:hypothetical protein